MQCHRTGLFRDIKWAPKVAKKDAKDLPQWEDRFFLLEFKPSTPSHYNLCLYFFLLAHSLIHTIVDNTLSLSSLPDADIGVGWSGVGWGGVISLNLRGAASCNYARLRTLKYTSQLGATLGSPNISVAKQHVWMQVPIGRWVTSEGLWVRNLNLRARDVTASMALPLLLSSSWSFDPRWFTARRPHFVKSQNLRCS